MHPSPGSVEELLLIIRELHNEITNLGEDRVILRGALSVISEWSLPRPSWNLGSNGERDYFKEVAENALRQTRNTIAYSYKPEPNND